MFNLARHSGLTLLEMLIALAIFAVIGVTGYRVLAAATQAQQITEGHSDSLSRYNKSLWRIDQDLQQIIGRSVRNAEGNESSALVLDAEGLTFTRAGWRNPLQNTRSDLQRIHYRLGAHPDKEKTSSPYFKDERLFLLREYGTHLDGQADSSIRVQALLPDVSALNWRIRVEEKWHTRWPPPVTTTLSAADKLKLRDQTPELIELNFQHATLGSVQRLIRVK